MPLRKAFNPFLCSFVSNTFAMIKTNNILTQSFLGFKRVGFGSIKKIADLSRRQVGKKLKPFLHKFIGYAHDLGKLIVGRIANANIITKAFTHAFGTIQTAKDRKSNANLRFLPRIFLEIASSHKAKKLFAASQLNISPNLYTIVALHEGIKAFMKINRGACFIALSEVVALKHSLNGGGARKRKNI